MANLNKIKLPDGTTVDITDGRIPSLSGNGGKVLKVNAAGNAMEWGTASGGEPLIVTLTELDSDSYFERLYSANVSVVDCITALENNRQVLLQLYSSSYIPLLVWQNDSSNKIAMTPLFYFMGTYIAIYGFTQDTDLWVGITQQVDQIAQENVIESITLNSTVQSVDENKNVTLSAVTSLRVNGTDYSPDGSGKISFSVSGGGGGAAALDVSDDNNGNLTLTVINSSNTLQVADDNAGNIALSLV